MWPYKEYFAVCWVLENTSDMSVAAEHRVYLARARSKCAQHFKQCNSDNEMRAIAAALEYHINVGKEIICDYSGKKKDLTLYKQRISLYERARKRILSAVREKV